MSVGSRFTWLGLSVLFAGRRKQGGKARRVAAGGTSRRAAGAQPPVTAVIDSNPAARRRRTTPELLLPETLNWARELPQKVRPLHTIKGFPHVANRIFLMWSSPEHFESYMRSLMLDARGGRQGFPPPVAAEIATLYEYHSTSAYPRGRDPWDRNYRR